MRAFKVLCCLGVVAMVCASVQAADPVGVAELQEVPLADQGSEIHVYTSGGAALATEPAVVYQNFAGLITSGRVPAADGNAWIAEDVSVLLDGAAVKGYTFLVYAFTGSAPYTVDSSIWNLADCADPNALMDPLGTCCFGNTALAGTSCSFAPTVDGYSLMECILPAPVTLGQDLMVRLDFGGATVDAMWMISEQAEVGYTDDGWLEDIGEAVDTCGFYWFGGAPYAGFYLEITAESAAAFECVPLQVENGTIAGNVATLACADQNVQIEWYARDWDEGLTGSPTVNGYSTRLICEDYDFDDTGTVVPSNVNGTPGPLVDYTMGIDTGRPSYFFPAPTVAVGDCNYVDCCDKTNPPCLACVTSGEPCTVDADCDPPDVGECSVTVPEGYYGCLNGIMIGSAVADDGTMKYMNTYSFYVPAGSKNYVTLGLDLDPDQTSLSAPSGAITPLAVIPCVIEVTTGMCCDVVGEPLLCIDGIDDCDCTALGGVFWPGMACSGVDVLPPMGLDDACGCELDSQCADGDACTVNECISNACVTTNVVVGGTECCDPTPTTILVDIGGSGGITDNFDGDQCTLDLCDAPGTCVLGAQCGVADNPIDVDGACDDGNACTIDDDCDAAGVCAGDDYNSFNYPCPGGIGDCPAGATSCDEGVCKCSLSTPLSIVVDDPDCCFVEGEEFTADVYMGPGSEWIVGAQFMVVWDPECIEFTGYTTSGVFPQSLYTDQGDDYLFLAMGINPFGGSGTQGDVDLATLGFKKLGGCTDCEICFDSINPMNTLLTSAEGAEVEVELECSCWIVQEGEGVIDVPDSVLAHSDCMHNTAVVTWDDPPSASQECFGDIDLICTAVHEPLPGEILVDVDHLLMAGGEFPQGTSTFCCGGNGECDIEIYDCWTVEVTNQNAMDVVVQLSPFMTTGTFTRCIEFTFYWSCYPLQSVTWQQDLVFGPPYDFPGKSTPVLFVPKGEYGCITAKDPLHTLRSADYDVECNEITGMMEATFHGDPLFHDGNWLVGGNLDGNDTIDIYDFGIFVSQFLTPGGVGADTACGFVGPHADINADGFVDNADFTFINMNFLQASKTACCDTMASAPVPTTEVTVKELRAMGLGHLAVADLDNDGVLSTADMTAFMQGNVPTPQRDTKRTGVRSSLGN